MAWAYSGSWGILAGVAEMGSGLCSRGCLSEGTLASLMGGGPPHWGLEEVLDSQALGHWALCAPQD